MEGSFMHVHGLTPEERKVYDNLFVIRDEAKESFKQFRKDYNILKSVVKRIEKKYGKTTNPTYGEKGSASYLVQRMLMQIGSKYGDIEWNLGHYKRGQKYFTKTLNEFPFDTKKNKGSKSDKLSRLQSIITGTKDSAGGARHHLRIANNYLKLLTNHLAY